MVVGMVVDHGQRVSQNALSFGLKIGVQNFESGNVSHAELLTHARDSKEPADADFSHGLLDFCTGNRRH